MIDPYLFAGALLIAIGVVFDRVLLIVVPFVSRWFNHRSSLRTLALKKKAREDKLLAQQQQQASSQSLQQQSIPTIP